MLRIFIKMGHLYLVKLDLVNKDVTGRTYNFKTGLEYFQVVTATTLGNIEKIVGTTNSIINDYIFDKDSAYICKHDSKKNKIIKKTIKQFDGYENLKFVILTRGVDPYTPKQKIEYDLEELLGTSIKIEGQYYLNHPIQPNGNGSWRVDEKTPHPHHLRSGNGNDWSSSDNNDDKLFNKSFLFSVKSSEFNSFDSKATTTYSSIDRQINSYLSGGMFAPIVNGYNRKRW
jgi:hypothetical protein